jgi:hypothetical protein
MTSSTAYLDRKAELSQKYCCAISSRIPVKVLPAWRGMFLNAPIQASHAVEEHVVIIITIIAIVCIERRV